MSYHVLGDLPVLHPMRNTPLAELGAEFRNIRSEPFGKWTLITAKWGIAKATFNELAPDVWRNNSEWRVKKMTTDAKLLADEIEKWADDGARPDEWILREWARKLRAYKPCATCNDDPQVCATVPGLRHCEAAMRSHKDVPGAWIPVGERVPEAHEFVLIYQPDAGSQYRVAYFDGRRWKWPYSFNYEHPCDPTHWMPPPAAPICESGG